MFLDTRASIAVPLLFPSVVFEGQRLVDGVLSEETAAMPHDFEAGRRTALERLPQLRALAERAADPLPRDSIDRPATRGGGLGLPVH